MSKKDKKDKNAKKLSKKEGKKLEKSEKKKDKQKAEKKAKKLAKKQAVAEVAAADEVELQKDTALTAAVADEMQVDATPAATIETVKTVVESEASAATEPEPKADSSTEPASAESFPDPKAALSAVRELERKLWCREYLIKISDFDGATVAPENGAAAREEAQGTLAAEHHELLCSEDSQAKVHELQRAIDAGLVGDSQAAAEARVLARDQREASAIPTEEAEAWTRLTCKAQAVWHKAKAANDWASFEPYVDQIVAECKRQAELMSPGCDPYDFWLDQNERGLNVAAFDAFCEQVKATVVPLVHEIGQRGQRPSMQVLRALVPEATQRAISLDLMQLVGLDLADTTLAYTEHPFSEGFARGDARIATHIYETDCLSNVFSIVHEAGHSMYELGVSPCFAYTALAGGTSMGIHESQSRFFENTIARRRSFMGPLLDVLRRHAPEIYGNVSEDELYRLVNIAQPSLVRTEADELTYPLHIMVRYEIERKLFAGEATAEDIPGLWKTYMLDYLGVPVTDNANGCLQDVHWSSGSFGYFPTYALGSAYDAQFVAAMETDGVDIDGACAAGDLAPVREWLRDRIWKWGRAKDAPELIQNACGAPFNATYYCDYLQQKFTSIYSL